MKSVKIKIPYGRKRMEFSLPAHRLLGVLENKISAAGSAGKIVSDALGSVLAGPKLEDMAAGKKKVLVVVPDSTRRAHLKEVLPVLLERIGKRPGAVTVIAATGLHRAHGGSELKDLVGRPVMKRCKVISHSQDKSLFLRMGRTKRGVPVVLNRILKECDLIISVGVIEPHLYAGYSGGAKTAAIGLAGRDTIDATHGTGFLEDPGTRIGSVRGNPFQETLWEIAEKAPADFSVNIVNDAGGSAVKMFAGAPKDVFKAGVALAKEVFEVEAKDKADIVICGIGHPKDINLYQASRAINYVVNVDRPVVRKGGVLIVAAELKHGAGRSSAERLFYDRLARMNSPQELIAKVRRDGCVAGEHRAYMVAGPLVDYDVILVSGRRRGFMEDLPFPSVTTVREAISLADGIVGRSGMIYVIPRTLSTIARRGGCDGCARCHKIKIQRQGIRE